MAYDPFPILILEALLTPYANNPVSLEHVCSKNQFILARKEGLKCPLSLPLTKHRCSFCTSMKRIKYIVSR